MFNNLPSKSIETGDKLFFNYGRSALKFFFSNYRDYYQKKLKIALQSFNCPVVMEAILQSGNIPILMDINLKDFSVQLQEISRVSEVPDILILTSYQGIPPQEYREIADYCRSSGIFLVEDLSHTIGSGINGIMTDTLSDASLFSYAIDKPFSCYYGGMLNIERIRDPKLKGYLIREYEKVSIESSAKTAFDLRMLKILLHYTDPARYDPAFDISFFFYFPKMVFIFSPLILYFPFFRRIFIAAVSRTFGFKEPESKITVLRLRNRKVNFILRQENEFHYDKREIDALEEFLLSIKLQPVHFKSCEIHWNRYSILDPDNNLREELKKIGVQAGNYNWPVPMHIMYAGNENIVVNNGNSYPNSEFACDHIVNIPVWCDFFQKRMSNRQYGQ